MKTLLRFSFAISLLSIALIPVVFAQPKQEVLTNTKIIELVAQGLPENIIVEKIRQSQCQCDTSTDGLKKLSAAKVPGSVIMAMMNAASGDKPYSESLPGKAATQPPPQAASTEGGLSGSELEQIVEPGIYLLENGKMTMIEPTVYNGTKSNMWGTVLTYGIKKSKIRATVRGKSANTQVSSRRPQFIFVFSREYSNAGATMTGFGGYAATSPNEFMMIVMKVKGSTREAELGEFSAYTASTGAADKDIREYSVDKLKPGLYKVIPKSDLAPGEYCFHYAGSSGTVTKLFDFSVK